VCAFRLLRRKILVMQSTHLFPNNEATLARILEVLLHSFRVIEIWNIV